MKSIGIDIGKKRCTSCIMDQDETVLKEQDTTTPTLRQMRLQRGHGQVREVPDGVRFDRQLVDKDV